jgi:glycosyltransferase involved in cell wall biosynthesis
VLGVPVVSFDNGGMTELASASGDPSAPLLTSIPYLDVEGMADAVIDRLRDDERRKAEGARLRDWVVSHHLSPTGAADVGHVVAGLLDG